MAPTLALSLVACRGRMVGAVTVAAYLSWWLAAGSWGGGGSWPIFIHWTLDTLH